MLKVQFLKWLTFWVSLSLWLMIWYFVIFAALNWDNLNTNVTTETSLSASLWNDSMTNIKENVDNLANTVANINTNINNITAIPGTIANVVTVQTREQWTYSAPISGNGTEITPLKLTLTPKKAWNKVILEWIVNGEMTTNTVYIVTRNWVLLTDTTNGSNNRWAWITAQPYDVNVDSTPNNAIIKIIDNNTLWVESNYELRVRSSEATPRILYLNRTVISTWTDAHEASLSTWVATEIWQ